MCSRYRNAALAAMAGMLLAAFACAHPALEAGIRAPLMLQTVLGFDADRIEEVKHSGAVGLSPVRQAAE